jgi:hypothetical protein
MVTIQTGRPGTRGAAAPAPVRTRPERGRATRLLDALRGVALAVLAPELAAVDADPAHVRRLLIDLGRLDPAAHPAARITALAAFQFDHGLPADGHADGATVSVLARESREHAELRSLGLA